MISSCLPPSTILAAFTAAPPDLPMKPSSTAAPSFVVLKRCLPFEHFCGWKTTSWRQQSVVSPITVPVRLDDTNQLREVAAPLNNLNIIWQADWRLFATRQPFLAASTSLLHQKRKKRDSTEGWQATMLLSQPSPSVLWKIIPGNGNFLGLADLRDLFNEFRLPIGSWADSIHNIQWKYKIHKHSILNQRTLYFPFSRLLIHPYSSLGLNF